MVVRNPALYVFVVLSSTGGLLADHGPGTTGGSAETKSGETTKAGEFGFNLRFNFTQYESLSDSELGGKASASRDDDPHVEALRWAMLQTFELSYGITDDFEVGASLGFYRADDVREAEIHDGELVVMNLGDVVGMTDWWLNAKYRFLRGRYGHWSAYTGAKLPLGRDDVTGGEENARLDPSLQPGSGAFDFLLGTAYTYTLTEQLKLHTSVGYIYRTENDSFKIGDRLDYGLAVIYRLMEEITQFPQINLVAEVNLQQLFKSELDNNRISNSGGTVLFLSPGIQIGFTENAAWTLSPRFPVLQELNDEQQDTLFKVITGLTFHF